MMLTINNLPTSTKYADVKGLIRQECGMSDFILDKLLPDGNGKRIQVGVMDDRQGSCLIKCLDGYRILGHVLSVLPLGQMQQGIQHAPDNNYDQGNYTPKGMQGNQGGMDYDNTHRPEPWNSEGHGGQWDAHQNHMNNHSNMGFQQQPAPINSYGQQPMQPTSFQQPEYVPTAVPHAHTPQHGYGGYNAHNNAAKQVPQMKPNQRPHVLRSVELVQEPARYDVHHHQPQQPQKPITIMKDNFQGPQFVNSSQYQAPGPSWQPPVQEKPFKSAAYERNFPEPSNRDIPSHDNYTKPVPRFSPRDDGPKDHGPRFSPRRDISKDGPRFSPRRESLRFSPRRDAPRFSPRRDLDKGGPGPRFSPRRDIPKSAPGPRFSPRRDVPKESPRFSPRRDIPKSDLGPRFSPRRDLGKSGPGPRFSPGRDIAKPVSAPRFSPRRDLYKGVPGSRLSPGRDILKPGSGPRFSPRRDLGKGGPGPRFSPGREIPKSVSTPRFSPRRDLGKTGSGPRFSPVRGDTLKPGPGPRFSPRRDIPKDGPRFSPRRDLKEKLGPRFSPSRDLAKDGPRFSPRRDIPKDGPRFSPRRNVPRFSPRRDIPKEESRPRFSPRRDLSGPRMSPGRKISPSRRMSPGRRSSPGDRRGGPSRSPRRESPSRSGRYSPSRRMDKPTDKYGSKDVRPAYDPGAAPNQVRYTDVYRPSLNENVQYPIPSMRQQEVPVWQQIRDKSDDRRSSKFEPNIPLGVDEKRLPERKSRSPLRSERFKRHSPSPRSPRRSWALEKRRSPDIRDAPPPPVWPGNDEYRLKMQEKKIPTWERPVFEDKLRRPEERVPIDPIRVRPDLQDPLNHPNRRFEDRFPRDPSPVRQEVPDRPKAYHSGDRLSKFDKPDFPERREESGFLKVKPLTKVQEQFEKEIEDVYKRAVEFTKRTEVLRKGDRKREEPEIRREIERDHDRPVYNREERRDDDFRTDERRYHDESYRRSEESRGKLLARHEIVHPEKKHPDANNYKGKKEKAEDDLADKLMKKYGAHLTPDMKERVLVELKIAISKILRSMFGYEDVSYIEMVIKFSSKYENEGRKLFDDVLLSFPGSYRKRSAEESIKSDNTPAKVPKRALDSDVKDVMPIVPVVPVDQHSNWSMANLVMQQSFMPMMQMPMNQVGMEVPMMMPQPVICPAPATNFDTIDIPIRPAEPPSFQNPAVESEEYNLFLCKDDFEPYSIAQAEYLKKFLITQLVKESQSGQGWAPDFTIKGLQSQFRYELCTRDMRTKEWIENLNFDLFKLFNVLVYTKEELWYERAAIWLPGHSKYRSIDTLQKLKLQNKKLTNVNLGKWKFVKQIVTPKGTRLYVDMPPSSARALEKHKMMLSYELQKVSVFLKAVAVDKDVFDQGLREMSVKDEEEIAEAIKNSAMPALGMEPNLVKIALKGNKTINVHQARRIKEMLIYHLYRYHTNGGTSKTDFTKFGFCNPGYFGVVAENEDSKKWLMSLYIGKLNKHLIEVQGANEYNAKFITMQVEIRHGCHGDSKSSIIERIKQHNRGVKGLNFKLWKIKDKKMTPSKGKWVFSVDIDLESVEALSKMGYQLDFLRNRLNESVFIRYAGGNQKLTELINKIKNEMSDIYDDTEMDIASSDDDDLVYLGEVK